MASDTITKLLQSVYDKVMGLLEMDRFYVALYDRQRGQLEFPLVVEGAEAKPGTWPERVIQPFDLSPIDGVEVLWPDWVITQGKAVLCEQDLPSKFKSGRVKYWPQDTPPPLSWLGVRLATKDQVLGALVVENRHKAGAFGQKIGLLTMVADQTAIALANARLRERLERQITNLDALYRMGQELTAGIQLSEQQIVELIYRWASQVMDTMNMYIALYDETIDEVRFALAYRDDLSEQDKQDEQNEPDGRKSRRVDVKREKGWQPRQAGKGRTEWIICHRQPLLDKTKAESEAWYQKPGREEYIGQPFASWVGVPMIAGDKVLGVIATYHASEEYVYDEADVQVLTMLANQAAVAIESARSFARETRRAKQLAGLQDIGVKITSQLELEDLLGSIAESVNTVMGADFSTLFLYNSKQDKFGSGARKGKVDVTPSIPSNAGLAAHIAKSQQALFAEAAEQEPDVKPTFIEEKQVKSFAGVPLVFGGKTVGIFFVNFLEPHSFSEQDRQTVQLLAAQAAVAIENAQLYADVERQVAERTSQLLDARRKLEANEKLALVNQVGAVFAHRINNMISTIEGRTNYVRSFLLSKVGQDHKAVKILDGITGDIELLVEASDELRGIGTPSQPTILEIPPLIEEALNRVSRSRVDFLEKITINRNLNASLRPILADRSALVETLENLMRNAVDAMPDGGTLSISARSTEHKGLEHVELEIADTGKGMPQEPISHLFDLFYSTKDTGLGFGLWRGQLCIRSMGGTIQVDSEVGKGTTFSILIPAA